MAEFQYTHALLRVFRPPTDTAWVHLAACKRRFVFKARRDALDASGQIHVLEGTKPCLDCLAWLHRVQQALHGEVSVNVAKTPA